jgi:predicted RNA binding protein YcfA (HicA-like mRNA interferase family)
MGKKLPLLTPREVQANLKALGFVHKCTKGSHAIYERPADGKRPRTVFPVDLGHKQFSKRLMKNMIRESKFTADEFCTGLMNDSAPTAKTVTEGVKNA